MDELTLRPVRLDDAKIIWLWRNSAEAYRYFKNPEPQSLQEHTCWIKSAIADSRKHLWIVEDNAQPVSHIRIDFISERVAAVSIVVDPEKMGKGIGKRSLSLAMEWLISSGAPLSIFAEVHTDNAASRRLFEAAGFKPHSECDPFLNYLLSLSGHTDRSDNPL